MTDEVRKIPRALIVRAAGTNCEIETKNACEKACFWADIMHLDRLLAKPELLNNYHLFIVPGGFSYGDDIGAGKVVANEIRFRLLDPLRKFIADGKLALGICNGFQILVKSGLLPDPSAAEPTVSLMDNDSLRYEDRWVYLKVCSEKSEFIKGRGSVIQLPVAHGEGKFVCRDRTVLDGLERNGQVVLRYVGASGEEAGYPWNPNGSVGGVAGLCDPTGRILGLMPHPERFADALNHPQWGSRDRGANPDGMKLFENAYSYVDKVLL